jgi:hypothetical protein
MMKVKQTQKKKKSTKAEILTGLLGGESDRVRHDRRRGERRNSPRLRPWPRAARAKQHQTQHSTARNKQTRNENKQRRKERVREIIQACVTLRDLRGLGQALCVAGTE